MASSKRILIVSAEASSEPYAYSLIEEVNQLFKERNLESQQRADAGEGQIHWFGVGSERMKGHMQLLGSMEQMAVVGFTEVIKKYSHLRKVFYSILEEVDRERVDLAILLDYPGFNLRLAKELKTRGVRVLYYISPQVWAWKKGRIKTIKENVDEMLVVLPFEEKFYQDHGVRAEFVGHPLLELIPQRVFEQSYVKEKRLSMGIRPDQRVLGLMPGSRAGEIDRLLPLQLEVARQLYLTEKNLTIAILVAPFVDKEDFKKRLENVRFPYLLLQKDPFEMISLTDFLIVTSGTATLLVALLAKPMVIVYKVSWLTGLVARFLVKGFVGLPNLLLGREVVPELLQEKASVPLVLEELKKILHNKEREQRVINELKSLYVRLSPPPPLLLETREVNKASVAKPAIYNKTTRRAAEIVLDFLTKSAQDA